MPIGKHFNPKCITKHSQNAAEIPLISDFGFSCCFNGGLRHNVPNKRQKALL